METKVSLFTSRLLKHGLKYFWSMCFFLSHEHHELVVRFLLTHWLIELRKQNLQSGTSHCNAVSFNWAAGKWQILLLYTMIRIWDGDCICLYSNRDGEMREESVSQGSTVSATKMKESVNSCFCILVFAVSSFFLFSELFTCVLFILKEF